SSTTRAGAAGVVPAVPPPSPTISTADWLRAWQRWQYVQTVVLPQVAVVAFAALQRLTQAQRYIGTLVPSNPPSGARLFSDDRLAFLFVAKWFRLHESRPFESLLAVQKVTAVYARLFDLFRTRTEMTPQGPRFSRVFSLPYVPASQVGKTDVAYVPQVSGSL